MIFMIITIREYPVHDDSLKECYIPNPVHPAGDINLHFIHMVGSEEKKSTPIILLHGWPSTVWEFHKSIPILVEQG